MQGGGRNCQRKKKIWHLIDLCWREASWTSQVHVTSTECSTATCTISAWKTQLGSQNYPASEAYLSSYVGYTTGTVRIDWMLISQKDFLKFCTLGNVKGLFESQYGGAFHESFEILNAGSTGEFAWISMHLPFETEREQILFAKNMNDGRLEVYSPKRCTGVGKY